ncbi:MAG: hypothetical protein F9K29_04085 [Hyphomicrobiaceae bacterium]|nr:MAG: hypothetical protein F9K29_04085 [Hyphomicrobiaceae bacterium]
MTQQWLTVGGLALDFLGFMLLLREWWLAFFNENRQLEMEEQLERMRAMRSLRPLNPGERNPWESLERVQDEQAIRKARGIHRAAMAARRATFLLAMVLIVAGFLLQIAGAWPGCCAPWITPQQ